MNRAYEDLTIKSVLAPKSLAASTEQKTSYVDGSANDEIDFILSLETLASGKVLTVKIYAADDSSGTNATKIAEGSLTASAATPGCTAVASARVRGDQKRYYCASLSHDSAAAIMVSAVALASPNYVPAAEANLVVSF